MHQVFVYGSLKRGFHNHGLLSKSTFLSEGASCGLEMYSLGSFPAVTHGKGSVVGEIWEVDDDTLADLDRLEGHPNFYRREVMDIWCDNMNGNLPCYVYVYQGQVRDHIPEGEWKHEHLQAQAHASWRQG